MIHGDPIGDPVSVRKLSAPGAEHTLPRVPVTERLEFDWGCATKGIVA
jgi:hypothetical protein